MSKENKNFINKYNQIYNRMLQNYLRKHLKSKLIIVLTASLIKKYKKLNQIHHIIT